MRSFKTFLQILGAIALVIYLFGALAHTAHGQDCGLRIVPTNLKDQLFKQGVLKMDQKTLAIVRPTGVLHTPGRVEVRGSVRKFRFLGATACVQSVSVNASAPTVGFTGPYYTYNNGNNYQGGQIRVGFTGVR